MRRRRVGFYTGWMEGPLPDHGGQRDYLLLICWGNVGGMARGNCWLPGPNKKTRIGVVGHGDKDKVRLCLLT
jgi:hypothetical protein